MGIGVTIQPKLSQVYLVFIDVFIHWEIICGVLVAR